eukprot:g1639.t1
MIDVATALYLVYVGGVAVMFLLNPAGPLKDSFPNASGLALEVGVVYHEVIGMMNMVLFVGTCPGTMGYLMGSIVFVAMMAKHILVNGLIPPIPVMALGGLSLLACIYGHLKKNNVGKWTFSLFNLLNAFVFLSNPGQPLQDSFPAATEGSDAYFIGCRLCEVIGTYALMQFLTNCPPPMGRAMAMSCLAGLVYKHDTVDGVGPPKPVLFMIVIVTCANWFAVLKKMVSKKSSDDAAKNK